MKEEKIYTHAEMPDGRQIKTLKITQFTRAEAVLMQVSIDSGEYATFREYVASNIGITQNILRMLFRVHPVSVESFERLALVVGLGEGELPAEFESFSEIILLLYKELALRFFSVTPEAKANFFVRYGTPARGDSV